MEIKSVATYGLGMDIAYEDLLSTGGYADLRLRSEDERSPELTYAWGIVQSRVEQYLNQILTPLEDSRFIVTKIEFKYEKETGELVKLIFSGSLNNQGIVVKIKTAPIRVNDLFDVMVPTDIGILRTLERYIRGYIKGERAQEKFDFEFKEKTTKVTVITDTDMEEEE